MICVYVYGLYWNLLHLLIFPLKMLSNILYVIYKNSIYFITRKRILKINNKNVPHHKCYMLAHNMLNTENFILFVYNWSHSNSWVAISQTVGKK